LPLKRLNRTAAWLVVIIKGWIDDFRVELSHCSQAHSRSLVPRVLRLTQHELSTRMAIAEIEPVARRADALSALGDDGARRPRVHTTHHDVRAQSGFAVAGIRSRERLSSGFAPGRTRWVQPKCRGFFLPKDVLSEVFRGKFTDGLKGL